MTTVRNANGSKKFDGEFHLDDWLVMRETHLRLTLRHDGVSHAIEAVMFGGYEGSAPPPRLRVPYSPHVN